LSETKDANTETPTVKPSVPQGSVVIKPQSKSSLNSKEESASEKGNASSFFDQL
jgi:hypothetical protein